MSVSEGICPFKVTKQFILHTLLTFALLAILMVQGVLLDMYLIKAHHTSVTHYFWLVPDFLLMVGFAVAMVGGFRHNKKLQTNYRSKRKSTLWDYKRKYLLGHHPYTYTMWFLYSSLIVAKVSIIFKDETLNVSQKEFFGPQLLKLLLASSSIVFVFLVEGHHNAVPNSAQSTYLKFLYSGVSLDILDSIAFLSLLVQSESRLFFSFQLQNTIIGFACITFVLPTIALYNLSITDYKHDSINVVLLFSSKMLHLLLTNIPYMVIRLYFWTAYSADISVFIIKNIIHIFVTLKEAKAEGEQVLELINNWYMQRRRVNDLRSETNNLQPKENDMEAKGSETGCTPSPPEFEEIDLSDVKDKGGEC